MSDTFEIDMKEVPKAILPTGAYIGTIERYEVKTSTKGNKYVQVFIRCLEECFPARINLYINNKNPQLAKLLVTLGWADQNGFTGTFDPKLLIGREVYVKVEIGTGYNGSAKQEFIYEFEYKSLHGIQPQSFVSKEESSTVTTVEKKTKEPSKDNLRKTFEKMKSLAPQKEEKEERKTRYEFEYPNFMTNDTNPLVATYKQPHPSEMGKGLWSSDQDRYGNNYWVKIPF